MAAIARAISHVSGTEIREDTITTVLIFSAVGLLVSLALASSYGLDLSPGFF